MKSRALAFLPPLAFALPLAVAPAYATANVGHTVVSLAFDDSLGSQLAAAELLAERGIRASFFVNSGRIGVGDALDWPQIAQIAAAGHEIGGHTVSHADLSKLDYEDQLREICDDRFELIARGYEPRTLAYPFSRTNEYTQAAVIACGYNAARGAHGLGCETCPRAESIPPDNPYFMRAVESVDRNTTLFDLQEAVRDAEAENGDWVQILFHHVCKDCGEELAVDPKIVEEFADWLIARGTPVRTIGEVIGGEVKPGVKGPPEKPLPRPEGNLLANGSLEQAGRDDMPNCWRAGGFGDNVGKVTRIRDAHDGSWAVQLEMSDHVDGDRKVLGDLDGGRCAPPVEASATYVFRAQYRSNAEARPILYVRDEGGDWRWFAQGPALSPSSQWALATWTLPDLPDGTTHVTMGISLRENGWIAADAFELRKPAGNLPAPPDREGRTEDTGCAGAFVGLAGLAPLLRRARGRR